MHALLRRPLTAFTILVALLSIALVTAGPAAAASKPVIKTQPKSVTAAPGTKVTFVVKAAKVTKYQWQKSSKGKWKSISKAKRSKFSVTARSNINGTKYRVKVLNGKKFRYSRAAKLTVRAVKRPVVDPSGSRTNPVPVWTPFNSGAWGFVLEPTDTDAWPEIQSANMFNDPPQPGYSYVTVAATVTYRGAKTGIPWFGTRAEFLGSDGRIYTNMSGDHWCGVVPQSVTDIDDMYPGASARGNYCAVVPTAAIAGGLWRVKGDSDDYSATPDVFVRTG